ncbi:hypothetical protein BDZ89DRAFT_1015275 [Hymenopellis radicata]|nr:hypothetical protein BDZ89DRAFT_1015275 [Hymenopellis radicata]
MLTALSRDLSPPITDLAEASSSATEFGSATLQNGFPETTIPGNAVVHGFTVLDNVYLRGGTFFIVTKNISAFPERRFIISRPAELGRGDEPTDKELRFINLDVAGGILGAENIPLQGTTVIVYDSPTFIRHLYHWFGEIILGFWRVYSKLAETEGSVPPPDRFIIPFASSSGWRDGPNVDAILMRAAFPDASIECSELWDDLRAIDRTIKFDRLVIINRAAAHRHRLGNVWHKMIASTMALTVADDFWLPIRESIVRSLVGRIPVVTGQVPLVTYVSRQRGRRRRLLDDDHDNLVAALTELCDEGICDFRVVELETMSLRQQVDTMARTTVMIGVHGNGLTHELWMPRTPKSTVIEIFYPECYLFDYEMLARNMGHKHYAVWNDTFLTYPKGEWHQKFGADDPEFQGVKIPVHGPSVARLIKERLRE